MIHEKRTKAERRPKPSEAFARHFGEQHGVDLPPPVRRGYKPLSFAVRTRNDRAAGVADRR